MPVRHALRHDDNQEGTSSTDLADMGQPDGNIAGNPIQREIGNLGPLDTTQLHNQAADVPLCHAAETEKCWPNQKGMC